LNIDSQNPDVEKKIQKKERDARPETQSTQRNKSLVKRANQYPDLKDFYNSFDPLDVTESDQAQYKKFLKSLNATQKNLLHSKQNFYLVEFENVGGLVMPIIFDLHFVDGSKKLIRLPVEIWNKNNERVTKLLMSEKEIKSIQLDPRLETADTDIGNNHYPPQIQKSRFKLFKQQRRGSARGPNPLQMQNKTKRAKK